MRKTHLLILVLGTMILSCKPRPKETTHENPKDISELLNEKFTGDLAFETTAFVEKYWRVVGNTGFNESIYFIERELKKAGFINESEANPTDQLTYRIEKRPLEHPTWEVHDASLSIEGDSTPLLSHATNRNMVALNSYSTPSEGVKAEVIYVENPENLKKLNVKGKIVFAESRLSRLYEPAIIDGGAIGLLSYSNPAYLQPENNTTSIQFRSIVLDSIRKPWAIALSYEAKERLKDRLSKGKVMIEVAIDTRIYPSEELTIIADIKGKTQPKERLVFSAHVQEPGANDNASGVGVALEMATLVAELVTSGTFEPKRSITFLWGDEIISTKRYVEDDASRAKQIKWGISLDMVGQNTAITGGSFLIEKMPDPSAVWTRGNDKHTEWGGDVMRLEDMTPHYLNDLLLSIFKAQGKRSNWEVNVNPFEGGSDHVPFLRNDIPSVLLWHFTDQFYHTDNDRMDKVSQTTLKNVGVGALITAFKLVNADEQTATHVINIVESAAIERLNEELKQGQLAIQNGESKALQIDIINAWKDWYMNAIATTKDMIEDDYLIDDAVRTSQQSIEHTAASVIDQL